MKPSKEIRVTAMAWVVFLTGCTHYLYQSIFRIAPGVLTTEIFIRED